MKLFLKKYSKYLLILVDLAIIPGMFLCHWLTDRMLANESVCMWTLLGGQCLTCGGTHFVNSLTAGHVVDAFMQNPYLFIITAYLFVTLVFLNLWSFGVTFGKKGLKWMYNIPTAVIFVLGTAGFLLYRTMPTILALKDLIPYLLNR